MVRRLRSSFPHPGRRKEPAVGTVVRLPGLVRDRMAPGHQRSNSRRSSSRSLRAPGVTRSQYALSFKAGRATSANTDCAATSRTFLISGCWCNSRRIPRGLFRSSLPGWTWPWPGGLCLSTTSARQLEDVHDPQYLVTLAGAQCTGHRSRSRGQARWLLVS